MLICWKVLMVELFQAVPKIKKSLCWDIWSIHNHWDRKSLWITKVIRIHHLYKIGFVKQEEDSKPDAFIFWGPSVSSKFCGNRSNSCYDIYSWKKMVHQPTNRQTPYHLSWVKSVFGYLSSKGFWISDILCCFIVFLALSTHTVRI